MLDNYKQSVPFFKFGAPNRAPYYYIYSLAHVNIQGLWMEFGVHDGTTLNLIAELMQISRRGEVMFYGFDSFEGLPEDWKEEGDRKNFDLKGELPKVAFDNIRLVKGWFDKTIPAFKKLDLAKEQKAAMIHIDSDIYSSAATVLEELKDKIVKGTVILFDQYHDGSGKYPEYKDHEYKAWAEFSEKYQVSYDWIAHTKDDCQASLIIKDIKI
tara:strand:- start:1836 stop:2471 length:636 start_codon:yes stop_codon:yes gene_type:complete